MFITQPPYLAVLSTCSLYHIFQTLVTVTNLLRLPGPMFWLAVKWRQFTVCETTHATGWTTKLSPCKKHSITQLKTIWIGSTIKRTDSCNQVVWVAYCFNFLSAPPLLGQPVPPSFALSFSLCPLAPLSSCPLPSLMTQLCQCQLYFTSDFLL